MALGTFISVGRSLEKALDRVAFAENLGYESAYVTHIAGHDSLTLLMAYASRTQTIRLGTGVLPIYSRTPVATAQQSLTVDEFSGGRLNLGLGVSHKPTVEGWYGTQIGKPVREMREYASAVRAILRGEDPPSSNERFPTGFHLMGVEPRPNVKLYLAALSPAMLRLAGEIGDGVILWLCNADYVRDVVVPEVRAGRERAGKDLDGFDVVAAIPSAVTDDPEAAKATLRGDLIPYFHLPFYRAMIERSGYEGDVKAFDAGGGDPSAISDRYLSRLAAIGSPDEAAETVRAYQEAGASSPGIGPVPRTDFHATLEALAP